MVGSVIAPSSPPGQSRGMSEIARFDSPVLPGLFQDAAIHHAASLTSTRPYCNRAKAAPAAATAVTSPCSPRPGQQRWPRCTDSNCHGGTRLALVWPRRARPPQRLSHRVGLFTREAFGCKQRMETPGERLASRMRCRPWSIFFVSCVWLPQSTVLRALARHKAWAPRLHQRLTHASGGSPGEAGSQQGFSCLAQRGPISSARQQRRARP